MNWVWSLQLRPSVKFVLMALADACDDHGYCWPSVPTIAYKTCLDDRSVQRILSKLKGDGLVQVQKRFRNDGSPTSNSYRLPINQLGDKLSPPLPVRSREVVMPAPPPGGSSVTQTTTESSVNHQPPQPITGSGELIFPKQLPLQEVEIARNRLCNLDKPLAQAVLDELAARLNVQAIRGSPLSYLRSLISRAEAGSFTPVAGVRVALARERERQREAVKQHDPPTNSVRSRNPRAEIEKLRKVLSSKQNLSIQE